MQQLEMINTAPETAKNITARSSVSSVMKDKAVNEAVEVAKPTLETELATYHRELKSLMAYAGKHVLIAGSEVLDVYDTYDDALKAGYQKVGLDPFMVKKIEAVEQIQLITRLLVPCPT